MGKWPQFQLRAEGPTSRWIGDAAGGIIWDIGMVGAIGLALLLQPNTPPHDDGAVSD